MATQQEIIFTALPNGVGSQGHVLSVLVSPRLKTSQAPHTLAKWLDFLDWPQTVAGFDWKLRFGSQPGLVDATPIGAAPRSDLWMALFPSGIPVTPYEFADQLKGFHNLPIISFPSGHVHSFLKETYLNLAKTTELPAVQDLLGAYGAIGYIDGREKLGKLRKLTKKLERQLSDSKAIAHGPRDPANDFAQMLLFHTPANEPDPAYPSPGHESPFKRVGNPPKPELDFHQALSMLGEHPQLERAMGIVVDLAFTPPPGLAQTNTVWVEPQWQSAMGNKNLAVPPMKTRCQVTPTLFEALPRAQKPEFSSGLLRLNDTFPDGQGKYELIQVDHDGAAKKTVIFINDVIRSQIAKHKTTDTPTKQIPPNFRSGGLSLARTERAKTLHLKLQGIKDINTTFKSGNPNVLSREDLTRGYAFDIYDVRSGQWYSLCKRVGMARFTPTGTAPLEVPLDEETGWVSLGTSQSADASDDRIRLHEVQASWHNGWSMIAPRPGKTVSPDEQPEEHMHETGDFKLEVDYEAAPGTLPPQRFGREYHLRARAVDLAGNPTPDAVANAAGFTHALGPELYGRFDPISPPAIVMRRLLTEAESPEFLVIRSNYATPANQTIEAERHIFPPAIDEFRAETLGMFDTPSGLDPNRYDQIVARQGNVADEDENGDFVNPDALPDPNNYGAPYYDVDIPMFPAESGQMARIPGLPDPTSRGAAFLNLPGTAPDEMRHYDWVPSGAGISWPNTLPFRLQVFESAGPVLPGFSESDPRRLRLGVQKADVFRVPMSSFMSEDDLEQLGLWDWLMNDAGLTAAQVNTLKSKVLDGRHWGFTPWRTLTLVHAVRQPLIPTLFANAHLSKNIGKTYVSLIDNLITSRKSTERLDVRAHWFEVEDFVDPDTDGWEPEKQNEIEALAFQKRIPLDPAQELHIEINERHELHHTRHVPDVEYRPISSTRFKEYFTERKALDFSGGDTITLDSQWTGTPAAGDPQGVVPESEIVTSTDGATTFERGTDYEMDYPAGEITRNASLPTDETKISYLVPPITREDAPPVTLDVLSSARPAAPRALYAVPNFMWSRRGGATDISSNRGGGSLRVYMDRPWWSSGAGELLGVVIWPGPGRGTPTLSDRLRPFVTQRGQDPIWKSSSQTLLPTIQDFTARADSDTDLNLEELPGQKFAVAAHEVHPDLERRLWYCDIDISPGTSYFPFLRLALARYQRNSVKGEFVDGAATDVCLSRVTLLDYIQLAPDRSATVTFNRDSTVVDVSVTGRSYGSGEAGAGPARMEVTLEERRDEMPDGDDNVGWVPAAIDPVDLTPQVVIGEGTTWTGQITLPQPRDERRYRLAIREFENIIFSKGRRGPTIKRDRLVYADTIEI